MTATFFVLFCVAVHIIAGLRTAIVTPSSNIWGCIGGATTICFEAGCNKSFDDLKLHASGYTKLTSVGDISGDKCQFLEDNSPYKDRLKANVTCKDNNLSGIIMIRSLTKQDDNKTFIIQLYCDNETKPFSRNIAINVTDEQCPHTSNESNCQDWKKGTMYTEAKTIAPNGQSTNLKETTASTFQHSYTHTNEKSLQTSTRRIDGIRIDKKNTMNIKIVLLPIIIFLVLIIGGTTTYTLCKTRTRCKVSSTARGSSKHSTCPTSKRQRRRENNDGAYKVNILYIPFELEMQANIINENEDRMMSAAAATNDDIETENLETRNDQITNNDYETIPEVLYSTVRKGAKHKTESKNGFDDTIIYVNCSDNDRTDPSEEMDLETLRKEDQVKTRNKPIPKPRKMKEMGLK